MVFPSSLTGASADFEANSSCTAALWPVHALQAVKQSGYEATAISDSLALEGLTDEMVANFSVEKPFSYSCGFDTVPKGQWRQPPRSLKVLAHILV